MSSFPAQNALLQSLYRSQQQRTDTLFENLLTRQINIPSGIRSAAGRGQNHLRDFLAAESARDPNFPQVLTKVDSDFLGGSFARHTKKWPLDDIDIYLPLDGYNLFYFQNGQTLPYTVQSDGNLFWNPLLSGIRWTNGPWVSSSKIINEFARILTRHYPRETEVRPNGECVSVRMSQGATANADGLGYDVVPCFSLKPYTSSELEFYLVPDGHGGWQRTNPRLDNDVCEILHSYHNRVYRKVVKLIKYWNDVQLAGWFSSYYLEFAISKAFWNRKTQNSPVGSISEGLAAAFAAVDQALGAGNQTSWISGAPTIERPTFDGSKTIAVSLALLTADLALTYEKSGNISEAARQWRSIFGGIL